jgi:predicted acylesterase/phospholipase RssA
VGVVLSTGDLRGVFAHTGFLLALEKLGISYQAIAGSSAGAVVAAIVASGRSVEDFADWLKSLKVEDYWEADSLLTILYHLTLKAGRGYTGIVSTNRLEKTIAHILKARFFEACPVSLYLIATNLTTGLKEVFHSGEIAPRAAASIAIPTLFKAKRIGDCYYVDGGIYEFTPKSAICCKENLNLLIVNQIKTTLDHIKGDNRFLQEKWSLVTLVGRVLDALYEKERVESEGNMTLCPCGCEARIVTLAPQIDPLDRLEPQKGIQLIQQGYQETLRLLPLLLKKLEERPLNPEPKGNKSCD